MYIVCGYKYNYNAVNNNAMVQSFGVYETRSGAWLRLTTLLGTQHPRPTGFSQSHSSDFGVLWLHEIQYGDNEINLNQPLALSTTPSS